MSSKSDLKFKILNPNKIGLAFEGVGIVLHSDSRYVNSDENTLLTVFNVRTENEVIRVSTFDKVFASDMKIVLGNIPLLMSMKYSKEYNNYKLIDYKHLSEEELFQFNSSNSPLLTTLGTPNNEELIELNRLLNEHEYNKLFKSMVNVIASTNVELCKITLVTIETINSVLNTDDFQNSMFMKEPAVRAHMFRASFVSMLTRFMSCSKTQAFIYAFELTNTPLSNNSMYRCELNTLGDLIDKHVFSGINERRLYDRSY